MRDKMRVLLYVVIAIALIGAITGCKSEEKTVEKELAETEITTVVEETMDTSFGIMLSEDEVAELFGNQVETEKVDTETISIKETDNVEETIQQKVEAVIAAPSESTQDEIETNMEESITQPTQEGTASVDKQEQTEYERYMAMSGDEQYAFYQNFESPEDFVNWLKTAQEEHEKKHPVKELDGIINLEEVIESQN